jgi:hypothetical protein
MKRMVWKYWCKTCKLVTERYVELVDGSHIPHELLLMCPACQIRRTHKAVEDEGV